MTSEPDDDKPVVSTDQDGPGRSPELLADTPFARGQAFMARYRTTFEALAREDGAVDREVVRQIELGETIMDEYGETFSDLAKPC